MQLPVDIQELSDEITELGKARDEHIALSIYLDETAPPELIAHVRNAFASSDARVRMTLSYIDDTFAAHPTDDAAIIVAGTSDMIGARAAEIREVGVPAMVVTLDMRDVAYKAEEARHPIPRGDIIATDILTSASTAQKSGGGLSEPVARQLDKKMGSWIVSVCRSKKLAFAVAFPFMRRSLALDSVQLSSLENAGVALVPFIQGADLPIITLNQAKMVLQIATAYGKELNLERAKEVSVVLVSAYVSRGLSRRLTKLIPGLSFAIRGGVAYMTTTALGYALINYFEGGGNATGIANVIEHAVSSAMSIMNKIQRKPKKAPAPATTSLQALPKFLAGKFLNKGSAL